MFKAHILLVACLLSLSPIFAQRIVRAEYFIDTDPGPGNGTAFSITAGDSVLLNTSVSTSGWAVGLHYLYVRAFDSTGAWSFYEGTSFYIYNTETPSPALNAAEYFVNADPGIAAGTTQPVNAGNLIDTTFNSTTFSSTPGFKTIYARSRDAAGVWSFYEGATTYIYNPATVLSSRISNAEYFLDTDPGLGNGTPFTVATGDSVQVNTGISTSGWADGMHMFYLRVRDSVGRWSQYEGGRIFVYSAETPSPMLSAAEFFAGSDPGVGTATALAVNTGNLIDTTLNTTVFTTGNGYKTVYGRTRDNAGVWGFYEGAVTFVYSSVSSTAARLNRAEYFLDSDPGLGNGTPFTVSTGDSVQVNSSVSTSGWTSGMHMFYLRVSDSLGVWSQYEGARVFVYADETPSPTLNAAEFFMSTDPGLGNATGVAVNAGNLIDTTLNVSGLTSTSGFKNFYGRTRDASGTWGFYERATGFVYDLPSSVSARIVKVEYFLDTDPGPGNGNPINVIAGDSVLVNTNLSTTTWTSGMHDIYVRVQDSLGVWSFYERATFYIYTQETTSPALSAAEMFISTDPGFGSGYSPAVNTGNSIDTVFSVSSVTSQTGHKRLYGRAMDMNGRWSLYDGTTFFVYDSNAVNSKLVSAEYFFDTDPGTGAGQFLLNTNTDSLAQTLSVAVGALSQGMHHVYLRFKNDLGAWSHYEGMQFYVAPDEAPAPSLVKAEYFIDSPDPGLGLGNTISFATADSVTITQNLATTAIDTGAHIMYLRAMDAAGHWSLYESYAFYMCTDFPAASFTHTELGLTANFNNTSTGALEYTWDFGDGNTGTQFSPNYTYNSGGTYNVRLIAASGGCPLRDTTYASVSVFPAVLVSVQQANVCTRDSLKVSIALTENIGTGNTFYIQLSDSAGSFGSPFVLDSVQTNKSVLWSAYLPASVINGLHYRVRVRATQPAMISNDNGSDIAIYASTLATFTYTGDTVFCSSGNLPLQSTSGTGLTYQWLKDGNPIPGAVLKDYAAFQTGLYRLRIINANNCINNSQQSVNILVKPIPVTPVITGKSQVSRNELVSYSVTPSTAGSVYTWTITGGVQLAGSNSNSIIVQWDNTPQLGKVSVVETAVNGCNGDERALNIGLALGGANNLPSEIQLAPNPFGQKMGIRVQNRQGEDLEVTVLDIRGVVVYQDALQLISSGEQVWIPFQDQPPGLYLVRLRIGGHEYISRAIHF